MLALASQAVAAVAGLVFLVAVIALVVQIVRRRPVRPWAIVAGGALVVALVFGALNSALYGPAEDQAEVERAEKPAEQEPPGDQEEEPAPEPNVEEEIAAAVAGAGDTGTVEDVDVTEQVSGDVGRYGVLVSMESQELADATLLGAMEDHQDVYQSLYTSEVADQISDIAVVSRVDGPTMTLDPAYKTSIDRQTAQEIDWESDEDMRNLPAYWEEEYVAGELQEE